MNQKLQTVDLFAQTSFWRKRPFPTPFLLALFFLLFITSCGLFNRDAQTQPPEGQAATQVNLVCSDECARRGQCGQTRDGRSVVLGHPERPAVQDHQMIFTTGSPMTFVSANTRRVQIIATTEEFDQTFYLITRPEDGRSGWVAGWCVNP